ncbi:MAG: C1 family peptidase [Sorangiineae bacterium]|nr:C1 family peptidase [Polyangiaceae bacterium]MEB2324193.1 C1 family peptidase [Sorangiineae bacterium]
MASRVPLALGLAVVAVVDCAAPARRPVMMPGATGAYAVPPSYGPPAPPPPFQRPWTAALRLPELPPPPPLSAFQWPGLPTLSFPPIPGLPAIPGLTAPAPSSSGGRCGFANVGGELMALDCITPTYGLVPMASRYILGRRAFALTDGDGEPAVVDHRANGSEGPIRNQGPVGACTAFSLAAAIDHAVATSTGSPAAVNVMGIWGRYHTPYMERAIDGNRGRPLGVESAWPYDAKTACQWGSTRDCDCGAVLAVSCGQPVDTARIARLEETSSVTLSSVTRLPDGELDELRAVLAKGQDVWFSMAVDDRMSRVRGSNAVVPDGDFRASGSGHAMVIAGYKRQSNGTYFLLHNSWGTGWGDNGYAWIHEHTLRTNLRYAYVVDVTTPSAPPQPVPPQPPQPNVPGQPTPPLSNAGYCPAGTVPDSGLLLCLPPCPDGSPRHFNTCAQAAPGAPSGCPAGQVNLFGLCVAVPRLGAGTDAATGIRHQCGASGCTYVVPGGVAGCTSAACMRSCPSPKYMLTVGPLGLGCAE